MTDENDAGDVDATEHPLTDALGEEYDSVLAEAGIENIEEADPDELRALREVLGAESATDADAWQTYFPYDEPYDQQRDAITNLRPTIREGGFVTLEAACGTGKTLISLMAGIDAVRDPTTSYDRVVVITSVKQQLRAFEDDLMAINENLPDDVDPVDALTLVGKADLCAYVDAGEMDDDRGFYGQCDDLRDPVRDVLAEAADADRGQKAERMANAANVNARLQQDALAGDDWTAPYVDALPTEEETDYCPFYAKFRAEAIEAGQDKPVLDWSGVMTPSRLMQTAAEKGLCPHAAMGDLMDHAEVLVANYYHAFEPTTVEAMTAGLIDDSTFLVVDEAHNLVPDVRDLLSEGVSHQTLEKAVDELNRWALDDSTNERVSHYVADAMKMDNISTNEVEQLRDLLDAAADWLRQRGDTYFATQLPDWQEQRLAGDLGEDYADSLRDPKTAEVDEFSEWLAEQANAEILERAKRISTAVVNGLRMATEHVSGVSINKTYVDTAGRVLSRWQAADHTTYFRQATFTRRARRRDFDDDTNRSDWEEWFSAHLTLNNCLPSAEIADRLDQFGGGILMSATLAPLDVYQRVTGLTDLADDRPLDELIYGLPFPEENRFSCSLDLPSFTQKNRGPADVETPTRNIYAKAIRTVARTTPGNVLVAMPSYAEAAWAGQLIEADDTIDKPVLYDEPSDVGTTEDLKQRFFAGDGKVLVTGMRGTLTEGVDFKGDRLAAAIVCGVPIRALGGDLPQAIRLAYETEFGKANGFEFAFSVPAVRKARQAIGRVIRATDDQGVRVLADDRYTGGPWNDVRDYLPAAERTEFSSASRDMFDYGLTRFWENQSQ